MRRATITLAAVALALAGCGGGDPLGLSGSGAPGKLGYPAFATKNTTRIAGSDPAADAAAAALAVFPSLAAGTHPTAVVFAPRGDWRAVVAASVFMARPVRAPLLLADAGGLPGASSDALGRLAPTGSGALGGAQVVRVGKVAGAGGRHHADVSGKDPATLAAAIDRLASAAAGRASGAVTVVSEDEPSYAMPAASWAAKSGDPVLFVTRRSVPGATRAAIASHQRPRIYVIGPRSAIGGRVARELGRLGPVTRIDGHDPVSNAIAYARYGDGAYGWGISDPGHGFVFASDRRPLDSAAAAALSASGTYGPLLLLDKAAALPQPLAAYLLDVQPGYAKDPVRGVYNHGWLIGDSGAISAIVQAQIDSLLEIAPVKAP
jgi:hypothetical protein